MTKSVLITGAGKGIGNELCRVYANEGWRVLPMVRDAAQRTTLADVADGQDILVADVSVDETTSAPTARGCKPPVQHGRALHRSRIPETPPVLRNPCDRPAALRPASGAARGTARRMGAGRSWEIRLHDAHPKIQMKNATGISGF
jgi:hypothetical protein